MIGIALALFVGFTYLLVVELDVDPSLIEKSIDVLISWLASLGRFQVEDFVVYFAPDMVWGVFLFLDNSDDVTSPVLFKKS